MDDRHILWIVNLECSLNVLHRETFSTSSWRRSAFHRVFLISHSGILIMRSSCVSNEKIAFHGEEAFNIWQVNSFFMNRDSRQYPLEYLYFIVIFLYEINSLGIKLRNFTLEDYSDPVRFNEWLQLSVTRERVKIVRGISWKVREGERNVFVELKSRLAWSTLNATFNLLNVI